MNQKDLNKLIELLDFKIKPDKTDNPELRIPETAEEGIKMLRIKYKIWDIFIKRRTAGTSTKKQLELLAELEAGIEYFKDKYPEEFLV